MSLKTVTVKVAPTPGGFTAIASTADLDRDGEVIDPGAFSPLPKSVPLLAFHDMTDPIGVCRPRYEGKQLMIDATFASTARAQEVRALVKEGAITAVSVGFLSATKKPVDGTPHIIKGELLEVSVVAIPSNRAALILEQRSAKLARRPNVDLGVLRAEVALARAALLTEHPIRPEDPTVRHGFTPSHARSFARS